MSKNTDSKEPKSTNDSGFTRFRWFLALYFLLIAGVMIRYLQPLPEQKPVIEFSGFAVVLFSLVFALMVLLSRSRWLILSLFPAIPVIVWAIAKKNRYLAMALEESDLLKMLPYTLIPVACILFFPMTYRFFSEKAWRRPALTLFFKRGMPW